MARREEVDLVLTRWLPGTGGKMLLEKFEIGGCISEREIGGFVSERERDLKLLVCVCVIASCTLFENVFMC